ncbi:glycogen debranching enzyme family protein [Waterburya agarophytonicola K14]|uniref:Glycogen debranching enzyme family protein n=1 Tax=Waterburya agarophytonicola KI4 TaxID=2874699 RepID=A0A964BN28_9CYAN|nr:amylo-alpha-1,6-glucosidase [Waterburya agarophytonicola]MCC0176403.1 glycogen debranching enzyme family protein [Waterburya agarophytonicola KI4]
MGDKLSSDILYSDLANSESREWLIANGIGGYGAGTISGLLTRRYHGLLIAALKPPLKRTLLLSKLNETAVYDTQKYPLYCDRWADRVVHPKGYEHISNFFLVGTTPVWEYEFADALLEKRIWMQQGENTTYIRYTLRRGELPLTLSLQALVNYRDHHGDTHNNDWQMEIKSIAEGIEIQAYSDAASLYLFGDPHQEIKIAWQPNHIWCHNYSLSTEKYRGLIHCEDHLLGATGTVTLYEQDSITVIASTEPRPNLDGESAWKKQYKYEQELLNKSQRVTLNKPSSGRSIPPQWISKLVLAANQFIVDRPTKVAHDGKTIIAGYPWFNDWGRDTMISLPGLTLAIGRPSVARFILRTYAEYVDRGMLPNVFPDGKEKPDYNTVDATLWYFEAIFAYYQDTLDKSLIKELFPVLANIITSYSRGTRYNIHQDSDGLLYAGGDGHQLTWMDAKVDDWVVTPRTGKPVEINALWYNALIVMEQLAMEIDRPHSEYTKLASSVREGFQKFWHQELGYCYDVIDTSGGNDDTFRPNQIFAVSLPSVSQAPPLLTLEQQKSIINLVTQELVTPCGLRTLAPSHPDYHGTYGGDRKERDGAYHQGTVWAWLIGHFVQAHLKVYQQPETAREFLTPMANLLETGCIGTIGEIFDADPPFAPRGCFAQAWSVAEVLRSWKLIDEYERVMTNK